MLYDIIVLEPSIIFSMICDCVAITCDSIMWPVTDVWHYTKP